MMTTAPIRHCPKCRSADIGPTSDGIAVATVVCDECGFDFAACEALVGVDIVA